MTVNEQLQELRERWKTASPANKRVIEIRAKLLKMSFDAPPKTTEELAEEIFVGNEQLKL